MKVSLEEFGVVLPEGFLILSSLVMLVYAAFTRSENAHQATVRASILGIISLIGTLLFTFIMIGDGKVIFNGMLMLDGYTTLSKILILTTGLLCLILMMQHLDRFGMACPETPLLIIFSILGMMVMVSAHDLMSFFLGLEMQSLSVYIIAALNRDDLRSNEAAIKYFLLGAISSAVILYGFSLIYGYSGTTNFDALADTFRHLQQSEEVPPGLQFALVLVLCGLAFKISAVPFHMWAPDVYEGVPTPVTAFFATVPKIASLMVIFRFILGPLEPLIEVIRMPLIALALASIYFGSLAAVYQTQIKRFLAYSSIGHVGFILLGLIAQSEVGMQGSILYIVVYVAMNFVVFACLLSLRREGRPVEALADLKGLNKEKPMIAAVMAILMFSMAGIPPLAGFWGKFYVILAMVESGSVGIAVAAIVGSVVSAFVYIRIIKFMFFDSTSAVGTDVPFFTLHFAPSVRFAFLVSTLCLALFSIYPDFIMKRTVSAVSVLLQN